MDVRRSSGVICVALAMVLTVATHAVGQDDSARPAEGQAVTVPPSGTGKAPPGGGAQGGGSGSSTTTTPQAPKLQFVIGDNNVVRVPTDTTTLTVTGLAAIEKLPAADVPKLAQSLAIADRGVARGAAARGTFELLAPEYVGRTGANGLTWRVPVKADVPLGTSHARVASVSLGVAPDVQAYALDFTVSAKPASASQWTPRGATDVWTVSWSDEAKARVYAITVENPDEPVANLRLAQSTLKDASGHTIGVDRLRLVDRPEGGAPGPFDVPGSSTKTFFLRLEPGTSRGPYGTFDGAIRLTADGSPAMKDVTLKIQASSTARRWVGVILTLLGLGVTIFVAALARPRMARLQARRAAAAVRQGIAQFLGELGRTLPADVTAPVTRSVAGRLADSISDKELDRLHLLPAGFALGPGFEASPDMSAALKARLEEVSKVLEGLLVLLRTGSPPVLKLLPTPKREGALALLADLDAAAERITGPQDARTKADAIAKQADALRGLETLAVGGAETTRGVTVSDLDFQIASLSLVAWGLWAGIALVVGAAWIFTDPDFGTTTDLVTSFTWGFGLTTFGAGIQSLTPNSVATQMTVKVPK